MNTPQGTDTVKELLQSQYTSKNNQNQNWWAIGFFILALSYLITLSGFIYLFIFKNPQNQLVSMNKTPINPSIISTPAVISPTIYPSTTTPVNKNSSVALPVVVFEPSGLFSDLEKSELNSKVIEPFFDYNNEKEMNFIAIIVNKKPSEKYIFNYMAIHKNGAYESSIIMQKDSGFEYWHPECMGPCEYSESFKDKYPQIVNQ